MRAARLLLGLVAAPAAAQGYDITSLLRYGFEVKAALPAGPGARPAADILYLQGRLPSDSQDIVVRCIIQPSAHDQRNCQRVY